MANETIIAYNGSTIATLEAGQTAKIKTAKTEVDHDIVVKAGSGGGGGGGSGEGFSAIVSIQTGNAPVIPTQLLIEKTTITIEGTGKEKE